MEDFSLCSFSPPSLPSNNPVAYMPHHSPRWPEIKAVLARIAATCRNILYLVSLFDYLEHLVNLGPPTTALLQLLPTRETFIGLGNYLFYHTAEDQRAFFFSSLLPSILSYASEVERIFLTSPLAYSRAFEEFSVSIPRSHVASLVACSFLCLYPNAQRQNCLFSDVNFTYFFRGITSESTAQVAKLQAILQYFACLSELEEEEVLAQSAFRIKRRSLLLRPFNQSPPPPVVGAEVQPSALLPFGGRQLVEALRGTRLPLALIENTLDKEIVSEQFNLPLIEFVNSYVGGGALRASELSPKSVYFRYPETLVALALCCRLEGPEALWIDNYLGPFGTSGMEATKPSTFRRLVVANSTRFPVWASELQYTQAGIIDDIVKTTTGLFQVDLDDDEIAAFKLPSPFSPEWWLQYSSSSPTETDDIPRLPVDCESFGATNLPSTREARIVDQFALHLSKVTLKEALQACGPHLVPQRSHRDYRSHPKCTLAPSPDRCSEYRQDSPPVPVSFAFSSFQNPAKMLRQNMHSRPLKSGENLRDSSCGASLGAVLEGLPSKFTETVGLLTNEVMSEAMGTVCKRLRGIYDFSDNLTKSLLKECLTSAENLPNAASPGNMPQRHLRPLTVDTGDREMQPQTLDATHSPLRERPAAATYFLMTPSHVRAVANPGEEKATYNERLVNFAISLASRCLLSALLQLRGDFARSHPSTPSVSSSADQSSGDTVTVAATNSSDSARLSEMDSRPDPLDRAGPRPSGFVTGPPVCGMDPQVNVIIQWISAAVASSSAVTAAVLQSKPASPVAPSSTSDQSLQDAVVASSPRSSSSSYLSPVVFATHGNPQLQQLHTVVNAVGAAGWNADHLLRSLLEYSEYRSRVLSGGPSSPRIVAPPSKAPSTRVLPFFDFLLSRFSDRSVRTLPI